MSAFMCTAKTLTAITWQLRKIVAEYTTGDFRGSTIPQELETVCKLTDRRIYSRLHSMNAYSLRERYGDECEDMITPLPTTQEIHKQVSNLYHSPMSKIEMYKRMRCYLYQCDTSDEIANRDLFRCVQYVADHLAFEIVRELEEYETSDSWE